ncbi:hypothetical protein [Salinispira pacifica]|nr:hypothetical protein [Salinispira pacifica]
MPQREQPQSRPEPHDESGEPDSGEEAVPEYQDDDLFPEDSLDDAGFEEAESAEPDETGEEVRAGADEDQNETQDDEADEESLSEDDYSDDGGSHPEIPEDQLLPEDEQVSLEDDVFDDGEGDSDEDEVDELDPDLLSEEPLEAEELGDLDEDEDLGPPLNPWADGGIPGEEDIQDIPDLSEESDDEEIPGEEEDTVIDYGLPEELEDIEAGGEEPFPEAVENGPDDENDIIHPEPQKSGENSPSEAPRRSADPEAQAKMLDYLLGLVNQLPPEQAERAKVDHLNERVGRLKDRLRKSSQENSPPSSRPAAAQGNQKFPGKSASPSGGAGKPSPPSSNGNPMGRLMESLAFAKDLSEAVSPEEAERLRERMRGIRDKLRSISKRMGSE